MSPRFLTTLTLLLSLAPLWAEVDFSRDIRPILNAKCTECHGGVKQAGGVSFVYREQVIGFTDTDSGYPVVTPGDTENSELIYRITTDDEDDRMPPAKDHAPLSADEKKLLKEWVESGAGWTDHWAFVPPTQPKVPQPKSQGEVRTNIDRFLFTRLESEELKPAAMAEPGRILRRLSLGLTGLPPTLEELDAFEAAFAKDPDATLSRTVDDLLSRPAFGERWASMWLDLVRYADSQGLGQDGKRVIWKYRDWVVDAFNRDLPFDEFTLKQLAGDLLPQPTMDDLIATACQRNTQTNNEGGTDDEEFRVEAVIDRVNTTWQTWGAMTFGCVQCHDHPYDPIRNTEYYRFFSYFNNSADSDLSNDAPLLKVPQDAKDMARAAELDAEILALKRKLWEPGIELRDQADWKAVRKLQVDATNSAEYAVEVKPERDEFHTVGTVPTGVGTIIKTTDLPANTTALKLTVLPHHPETAIHSPEWGFVISKLEANLVTAEGEKSPVKFMASVPDVPWMPANPMGDIAADGRGWGADSRIHQARELVLVPETPLTLAEGSRLELTVTCSKTGHGHPMVIKRGYLEASTDQGWAAISPNSSDLRPHKVALAEAKKARDAIKTVTLPVMGERPSQISRPTYTFIRGNTMEKGEAVDAGLPASFVGDAAGDFETRLDMAKWWIDPKNPLTARVYVNRVWAQLFGRGLVDTVEDFGTQGSLPSSMAWGSSPPWKTLALLEPSPRIRSCWTTSPCASRRTTTGAPSASCEKWS